MRFGVAAEAKTPLVPAKPAAPSAGVVGKPLMGAWVTIAQRAATFRWHLMTASGDQQRPPQRLMKYHACRAGGAAGGPATVVDSGINPARVLYRPFPSPGGALAPSVSTPTTRPNTAISGPCRRQTIPRFARAVRRIGEDEQYRIAGAAISSAAATPHLSPVRAIRSTPTGAPRRAAGTHRYYQDFRGGPCGTTHTQRVGTTNADRTRGYNRAEHLHQHAKTEAGEPISKTPLQPIRRVPETYRPPTWPPPGKCGTRPTTFQAITDPHSRSGQQICLQHRTFSSTLSSDP